MEIMKYDLVGIGKINYDIVDSDRGRETFVGGSVPNIISCAQLIGLKVALIARVGKDRSGKKCLAELKHRGVDVSNVVVDEGQTPSVTIKLTKNDRIITPLPSKLTTYTRDNRNLIKNAQAVFVDTKTINLEACINDCIAAKALVVSSLQHFGDPYDKGIPKLMNHTPDVLFANKEEAENNKDLVDVVLSKGGTVVTTLGSLGCRIEKENYKKSYKAFKVKLVDATGAGDAFSAGYLFGLIKGFDERRCAEIANAMGAIAISQRGPVPLVTWSEVEHFLASHKNRTGSP